MAAEVDFGDLQLFEAFDPPQEAPPKPVHTRFPDAEDEEDEEDVEGAGANGLEAAGLRERLRECEATVAQLRAENILPPARPRCIALRCIALRCTALHCVALRRVAFRGAGPVVGGPGQGGPGPDALFRAQDGRTGLPQCWSQSLWGARAPPEMHPR